MASAEVVEAGRHQVQVGQVELASKELGEVVEEVLTGRYSGLALEVEGAVLEMR